MSDKPLIETQPDGLIGTVFDGKYEVLGEVARGGMGIVFRGVDRSLGRPVAIKVLLKRFNSDAESVARFRREARAMAALDHPNIVPVYAIGNEYELHYFVMKFITGWTVAERLKRVRLGLSDPFSPEEVRLGLIQVCRGLSHAHLKGLIHRDIKPSNIMISASGHVTIMDFGIVKETNDDSLTKTGIVFGTPDYMAPEHAQGHPPSAATDLYSLGIVAYEMLAGEQPFSGSTPFSLVLKHIKEPPPPLIDRRPDVDIAFQDILFRATEKAPEDRYPTASAMMHALESLVFDESTSDSHVGEAKSTSSDDSLLERSSLPTRRPTIFGREAASAESDDVSTRVEDSNAIEIVAGLPNSRPGHYRELVTQTEQTPGRGIRRSVIYGVVVALVVSLVGLLLIFQI